MHDCIFERQPDPFAWREQALERCRCHTDVWTTRQPTDPPYLCPETGQTAPKEPQ